MRPIAIVVLAMAAAGCSTDDTAGFHASLNSGTIALVHGKVDTLQLDVALDGDNVVGSPIFFDVPDLETNVDYEVKIADLKLTLGDQTWSTDHVVLTDDGTDPQPLLEQCGRSLDFGACISFQLADSDFSGICEVVGSVAVTCD